MFSKRIRLFDLTFLGHEMRVCRIAIKFGLTVCLLVAAGCDGANFQFVSGSNNHPGGDSGRQPFAVLSMAPTHEWFGTAQSLMGNSDDKGFVWDKKLRKIFGAIDTQRQAAVFFLESEKRGSEPVIYLPVEDYDRFLDQLARQCQLKRAIASSFDYGPYRFLVKQVGEYAVIGTSLEGIKKGPTAPEVYLQSMPQDDDFSFRLNSKSTNKRERMKLANSIHSSFGADFAKMFFQCDSFDCGLRVDSSGSIQFHAQVRPLPENSDEIRGLMIDVVAARGGTGSTEIKEDSLVFDIAFPSDQANSAWAQIQPGVLNAFVSQLTVSANRSPSRASDGPFGLPMLVESGEVFLPGSSSGSSGGAACRPRRS